jgi:hypothetical protein
MFKKLALLATLALALIGAACDQTQTSSEPKKFKQETAEQKAGKHAVDVMTTASAIGALHFCRANKLYDDAKDVVDESFYRMAGVMRAKMATNDEREAGLARAAFSMYVQSGQAGIFAKFTTKDGIEVEAHNLEMKDPNACKTVEAFLIAQRAKGKLLDAPRAKPIETQKSTEL